MNLFTELKRRNVFRVAAAYLVGAWLLIEVADTIFPRLGLPDWTVTLVIALLALGLPVALFFAWAFELTPEGVKRTEDVAVEALAIRTAGRKLDLLIIGVLVLALGWFAWDKFLRAPEVPVPLAATAEAPAATSADKSIAVLPFVNMSADPEQEYFADGLSEELLNVLARVPAFRVVGRTSSFAFKGENIDLREIGARLGVAYLLEGSVRRAGERLRITAQLIRSDDGVHLWSETYDRSFAEVFEIQDDIAANVLRAVEIVLDEDEYQRMTNAGVRDVEAFVAFQKGLDLFGKAHGPLPLLPTLAEANALFDQAIARVPEFGAAHYLKSDYYAHILFSGDPAFDHVEALAAMRTLLDTAYESSREPERRAFIDVDRVLFSDDWSALADRVERALDQSGCPQVGWIEAAIPLGYASSLVPMYQRVIRCEPLNFMIRMHIAHALVAAGMAPDALASATEALRSLGEDSRSRGGRQLALLALGRNEDAAADGARIPPDDNFFGLVASSLPLAATGRTDEALDTMATWLSEHDERDPSQLLTVLAATGQRQRANALAARLDAAPAGPVQLLVHVGGCLCGLPFDMSATPNLARRIAETGRPWPPPTLIHYPAKDW